MKSLNQFDKLISQGKRKLYFHLGVNAGFFSEFNNMILALLYCIENQIQFVLYSADANFKTDKGWTDFFLPFCPETTDNFHHINNFRWLKIYHPYRKIKIYFRKRANGIDLLTHDIWRKFKNEHFAKRHFSIPELGINGCILDATRILHSIVWRYNENTSSVVTRKISDIGLDRKSVV